MAGTIMRLLIRVSTLDENDGELPKKFLAYPSSSSKPRMLPSDPIATPAFNFLSWQFVMFGQLASPPKSYPMNGLMEALRANLRCQTKGQRERQDPDRNRRSC